MLGEVSLIWEAFNYINNILEFLALESNYFKVYHNMHICKFKMLSMSLIFSCRNYSNTLCGTVVVYSGFQNILWAILVIGMFSTVWWNIFEFRFMSGGIFSTGKNSVENFLSKNFGVENFPSLTVEHFPLLMNPFVENFLSKIVCFPKNRRRGGGDLLY